MRLLEERIKKDGQVYEGNVLKVNSFLNHQIDISLLKAIGEEFYRLFDNEKITKILTVETSGIPFAVAAALFFDVPVVFAKKHQTSNLNTDCYSVNIHSFTHGNDYQARVESAFISAEDNILIIDDFLASGHALKGLLNICEQAGAHVAGCGIVIEKSFQDGGRMIRDAGVRVESLAKIKSMENGEIIFE